MTHQDEYAENQLKEDEGGARLLAALDKLLLKEDVVAGIPGPAEFATLATHRAGRLGSLGLKDPVTRRKDH